jgi:hypothetical protein
MKIRLILICSFICCLMTVSCVSFGSKSPPEPIANASSLQDYAGIYADASTDSPPARLSARFGMRYNYMLNDTNDDKPTRIEIKVGKRGLEATAFHGGTVGLTGEMLVSKLSHGRIDMGTRSYSDQESFIMSNVSEHVTTQESLAMTTSRDIMLIQDISSRESNWGFSSYKTESRYYVFKRVQ